KEPQQIKQTNGTEVTWFPPVELKCRGSVVLTGDSGDDLGGFTLGWFQVAFEMSWAEYRGRDPKHGSMLVHHTGKKGQRWHVARDGSPNDTLATHVINKANPLGGLIQQQDAIKMGPMKRIVSRPGEEIPPIQVLFNDTP